MSVAYGGRSPGPWRPRRMRLVAVFFVAYVALQVLIPTLALTIPTPTRFGWQMYSRPWFPASYIVVRADGVVEQVDPAAHLAYFRPEVELERFLPPHLCRVVPEATAVRVSPAGG